MPAGRASDPEGPSGVWVLVRNVVDSVGRVTVEVPGVAGVSMAVGLGIAVKVALGTRVAVDARWAVSIMGIPDMELAVKSKSAVTTACPGGLPHPGPGRQALSRRPIARTPDLIMPFSILCHNLHELGDHIPQHPFRQSTHLTMNFLASGNK